MKNKQGQSFCGVTHFLQVLDLGDSVPAESFPRERALPQPPFL